MSDRPTLESAVALLAARGIVLPAGRVFFNQFGDSPELSRSLLALIRQGGKRAGTSLLWGHEAEGDPVPQVGDIAIVLDDAMTPSLVTINRQVDVICFDAVSPEYAAMKGEGDGSREYWRREHWGLFFRECAALGRRPDPAIPVVCAVFDVLHTL